MVDVNYFVIPAQAGIHRSEQKTLMNARYAHLDYVVFLLQPHHQFFETFTPDFLAGLHKWTRLDGAAALPPVLVYGGDDNMIRQGVTVQSWRQIYIEN